jgi:hypothetical protein
MRIGRRDDGDLPTPPGRTGGRAGVAVTPVIRSKPSLACAACGAVFGYGSHPARVAPAGRIFYCPAPRRTLRGGTREPWQ